MTTYSFTDSTGAFFFPTVGQFIFGGGNIGIGQITISMTTERTEHDVAADGGVMVSYIPGDNGSCSIEMQQTCAMHGYLLNAFNANKLAADAGDVGNWAAGTFMVRNLVDGSFHTLTGVSFGKVPDKVYQARGQKITWALMAAKVINE